MEFRGLNCFPNLFHQHYQLAIVKHLTLSQPYFMLFICIVQYPNLLLSWNSKEPMLPHDAEILK